MDINKVATLATRIKKVNKAEAFAILRGYIAVGGELTEQDCAELYSFFLPSLPAQAKTLEQWVAKAVGDRDVRFYLNYLYSDGKYLIGTDGHRMHRIGTKLKAGYYDKALSKVEVDYKYPDTARFWETRKGEQTFDIVLADLPVVEIETGCYWAYEIRIPGKKKRVYVNRPYLVDAVNRAEGGKVTVLDSDSHVIVDGNAVVMPMRRD